jgi:mannose-6-phosphate isomerase-like protein (cupin superfamily)
MKHIRTTSVRGKFNQLAEMPAAQVLLMTLNPGEASDQELFNEHLRCEQWMYVIQGSGEARTGAGRRIQIAPGSLVVSEKRERHQICATGTTPLRTLNFYVPPAYSHGRPRIRAK